MGRADHRVEMVDGPLRFRTPRMGLAIPDPLVHSAYVGARQLGLQAVVLHHECRDLDFTSGSNASSLLDQIGVECVRPLSCEVHHQAAIF